MRSIASWCGRHDDSCRCLALRGTTPGPMHSANKPACNNRRLTGQLRSFAPRVTPLGPLHGVDVTFHAVPLPHLAHNGLAAVIDRNVLNNHLLLTFRPVALQRLYLADKSASELIEGTRIAILLRNSLSTPERACRLHGRVMDGRHLDGEHRLHPVGRLNCCNLRQHLIDSVLIGLPIPLCQIDHVLQDGCQLAHPVKPKASIERLAPTALSG